MDIRRLALEVECQAHAGVGLPFLILEGLVQEEVVRLGDRALVLRRTQFRVRQVSLRVEIECVDNVLELSAVGRVDEALGI